MSAVNQAVNIKTSAALNMYVVKHGSMICLLMMNSVLPLDKLVTAARESMLLFFISSITVRVLMWLIRMVASAPANSSVQSMNRQARVSMVDLMGVYW